MSILTNNNLFRSENMAAGYLTVKETKDYLKIGSTKMSLLLKEDNFPCVRLGRRVLIIKDALDQWMLKRSNANA
jgi:excisionase family DNA binding protein